MNKWKKVGVVGVDSGCILLGDPCYWIKGDEYDKEVCSDWDKSKQIKFDLGHNGKGVLVSSGFGDGCYEVFVNEQDYGEFGKRIKEVKIVFVKDEEAE